MCTWSVTPARRVTVNFFCCRPNINWFSLTSQLQVRLLRLRYCFFFRGLQSEESLSSSNITALFFPWLQFSTCGQARLIAFSHFKGNYALVGCFLILCLNYKNDFFFCVQVNSVFSHSALHPTQPNRMIARKLITGVRHINKQSSIEWRTSLVLTLFKIISLIELLRQYRWSAWHWILGAHYPWSGGRTDPPEWLDPETLWKQLKANRSI